MWRSVCGVELGEVPLHDEGRHCFRAKDIVKGLEVDRTKIEVIEKLPPPISMEGIRSFLGYARFYRTFIKDFSKIAHPFCKFLEKKAKFEFDEACLKVFECFEETLVVAPIIITPDWSKPFEVMCDASGVALDAVLGQKRNKIFRSIYYARKELNEVHKNYTMTEQELLAVVYAAEKFQAYLLSTRIVVHTDHSALRYIMENKDAKPRLIRRELLLREFDFEVKDRKGYKNRVKDHLLK